MLIVEKGSGVRGQGPGAGSDRGTDGPPLRGLQCAVNITIKVVLSPVQLDSWLGERGKQKVGTMRDAGRRSQGTGE